MYLCPITPNKSGKNLHQAERMIEKANEISIPAHVDLVFVPQSRNTEEKR